MLLKYHVISILKIKQKQKVENFSSLIYTKSSNKHFKRNANFKNKNTKRKKMNRNRVKKNTEEQYNISRLPLGLETVKYFVTENANILDSVAYCIAILNNSLSY